MQLYANIMNYYKISRFKKLPVDYFKLACRYFPYMKVFSFCIVRLVDSHLNAIIAAIRLHASITKKIFFIAEPLEAYSWTPPHKRVSDGAPIRTLSFHHFGEITNGILVRMLNRFAPWPKIAAVLWISYGSIQTTLYLPPRGELPQA